jgi:hypothetical protein
MNVKKIKKLLNVCDELSPRNPREAHLIMFFGDGSGRVASKWAMEDHVNKFHFATQKEFKAKMKAYISSMGDNKFIVGDFVRHNGWEGRVVKVDKKWMCPVVVNFKSGTEMSFTLDGRVYPGEQVELLTEEEYQKRSPIQPDAIIEVNGYE